MSSAQQELQSFNRFAEARISEQGEGLSLDELFDQWRAENPSDEQYDENVKAIAASIRDFADGERGAISGSHSDDLRKEFGLGGS